MPNHIFDSHAHYDDKRFDSDRDQLLGSLPQAGVCCVMTVATDLASSPAVIALADRYHYIYAGVGVHPHEAESVGEDLEPRLRELAAHPRVRAIGEIGLDYHYDFAERGLQRQVFRRQLEVARELDMPVIVHDREAHRDTLELLKEYRPQGVVHCYSGSAEMAAELVKLGLYIGFTGVVTFKGAKEWARAQAAVPLDRLLIETDCPYLAPVPYRGKRCDSSMLTETASALAHAREMPVQDLIDATCRNAMRLFGISGEPGGE